MGIKTRFYTYKSRAHQDVFWLGFTTFAIGVGFAATPDAFRDGNWGMGLFYLIFTVINIWLAVRDYRRLKDRLAASYIDDLPGASEVIGLEVTVERKPKV